MDFKHGDTVTAESTVTNIGDAGDLSVTRIGEWQFVRRRLDLDKPIKFVKPSLFAYPPRVLKVAPAATQGMYMVEYTVVSPGSEVMLVKEEALENVPEEK